MLAVFLHPFTSVPVTVYVVVTVGLAVTELPLVVARPVPGFHTYIFAPVAVKETVPFTHIE